MCVISLFVPRAHASAARANAKRFAEAIDGESDETMKAYFRHLAMSWHRIAAQYDLLDPVDTDHQAAR